jgi:hypothetical protein
MYISVIPRSGLTDDLLDSAREVRPKKRIGGDVISIAVGLEDDDEVRLFNQSINQSIDSDNFFFFRHF